ncbi:MAG TPA: glycoside hydrolase family 95 protein, partial [Bacteroidales bacterium]|nr:glycoside hydrolase family 95 protein [Bacteroidales bacterium]
MEKRIIWLAFASLFIFGCTNNKAFNHNESLWYTSPARYWNSEALHLGNGYMGVSYYGGIEKEVLELSEKSIWTGGPFRGDWEEVGVNPECRESLPEIARLIAEGKIKEADDLVISNYLGTDRRFGGFSALGSMHLLFDTDTTGISNYKRSLDLSQSLGLVDYASNGIHYSREYFCSYPDRIAVIRLKADKRHSVHFEMGFRMIQDSFKINSTSDEIEVRGMVNDNQRPFSIRAKIINNGGETISKDSLLVVKNADEVTILYTFATNYKLSYPDYTGRDPSQLTRELIDNAAKEGYTVLKEKHIRDYQNLYSRVNLHIDGNSEAEEKPTDVRWQNYKAGQPDAGLKVMAFNLGRYLIISSSRPGTLPANLQ